MKAVILDLESLEDLDLSPIEAEFDQLDVYMATAPEQVAERIDGCDVVITNKVKVGRDLMSGATNLKLICVVATGTNNIDLDAASEHNVRVSNCVAYGVDSVAQHVMSMILALHTNIVQYDRAVKSGEWGKASQFCMLSFPIRELAGRTLGIYGYGNLGSAVAHLAEAFGMKVVIAQRPGAEKREGRLSMDELLAQADVLSLHCPLTEETKDLVDAEALAKMKPGSMLINAARGGVVNEDALADALRSGQLAGAATDVLTEEPPVNGNVLLSQDIPNLIITPHSAWGSREARQRILDQTLENIQGFKAGSPVRTVN
ncbi:2-hydroxyacid dehydrogenase [Pontibacterium granulatum]|uniref:2-hydroxyacid dehydrogenase n=1 Tax=Pontibacterium granulatum TaxID=2036029 RepID=UPI00249CA813|nr:2-hydroxyacid dehydrogenase [Pontibacterium granulatum]MDI3326029.1 2-hydroxyacid dehydrogenase [Pontibacterium granulatum]